VLTIALRRRQFYRKISEWGFEKNIKDKEMRTLVQDLNQRRNDGEDLAVELRGQQIDPVKIHRWQKRYGRMKDVVRPFSNNPSMGKSSSLSGNSFSRSNRVSLAASPSRISNTTYGYESQIEASGSSTVDPPTKVTKASRATDVSKCGRFDYWNLVDVQGSPLLSRLFEALKIECESSIPSLDITSSSPVVTLLSAPEAEPDVEMTGDIDPEEWIDFPTVLGSKDLVRYSQEVLQGSDTFSMNSNPGLAELSYSEWSFREWDFSRGQPLKMNISHIFGLSPFPTSSEASRNGTPHYGNLSPFARSRYLQAEETKWRCRLRKLKLIFGAENLKTLEAMDKLADVFHEQQKFRQAERLYRQIAISYQRTLGLKHADTLSAYLNIIEMLSMHGEWLQANKIHQRLHNDITGVVDQHDQLALRSNSIKAEILFRYGQADEADKLIRQNLQIGLCILGPRRTDTLSDMRVLAQTLSFCGQVVEGERLVRIIIQLYHELEGAFSVNFLSSVQFLADLLLCQRRYDESRDLAIMVAERLGTLVGLEHADTLYSLYTVARCSRRQGDLSESERQLRSILEKQIKTLGDKDPDTCDVLGELSGALVDMGRYSEAVTLLERRYKGLTRSLGVSHIKTLWCCQDLGDNYEKLGRYEDAIELLQRSADDARVAIERPSKASLYTILKLARLLEKLGRFAEAISFYEECFDGFIGIYKLSLEDTGTVIDGLGLCYEKLGYYEDAVALLQRIVDNGRKAGEKSDRTLLGIISKLARFLRKTGRYKEAIPYYEECFHGFVEIYGLSHPWTIYIIDGLGFCYERLGRYDDALAHYQQKYDQIRSINGDEDPALKMVSDWMTALREIIDARHEKADEMQEAVVIKESPSVTEALMDKGYVNLQGSLADGDVPQTEEDWMGELFDFDLLENRPSNITDSNADSQVDENNRSTPLEGS
jgi:tetratricopeptide (TPR) repeat protein